MVLSHMQRDEVNRPHGPAVFLPHGRRGFACPEVAMGLDLSKPRKSKGLGRGRVPREVRKRLQRATREGEVAPTSEQRLRMSLRSGKWDNPRSWNSRDRFEREKAAPHRSVAGGLHYWK